MRGIFSRISSHYDRVNRIISLGQDRRWRSLAAEQLPSGPGLTLDLASGTGELSLEVARRDKPVLAMDICVEMMQLAQAKTRRLGLGHGMQFILGHALYIPFATGTFQGIVIGFALRDLPALDKVMAELYRVLQPKGKLVLLELTKPSAPFISFVYGLYLFRLVPFVGRLMGGDAEAYAYLPRSLVAFPQAEELAGLMRRVGFREVAYKRLALGVVALHWGYK